ncbi:hypothetical protein [Chromobacterium phragmitis]|uniref:Tetratricopeptide repeat protein n=1 Tax=Chromobacterium phragmitis TaxID=2202141 RepID=A0A344UDS3_9NEIS|nr:hypothetical protein [Chromobacterium phragmitis]AXE33421.1 hypothetical protein DK843_03280 [Chromobacterium phragmitis]
MRGAPVWIAIAALLAAGGGAAQTSGSELAQARVEYWRHPYQPEAINRLATLLAARGDAATAALLLERALLIAPDRADIRANLARARRGERRLFASAPSSEARPAVPASREGAGGEPPALWPPAEPPSLW